MLMSYVLDGGQMLAMGGLRRSEDGIAEPGTDLAAINEKRVSVTPIYLNLTNIPVLASLKRVFV